MNSSKGSEILKAESRILYISYIYPPVSGMSSLRVAHFVKGLVQKGHKVDVLTINPAENHPVYLIDKEALKLIPSSVKVYRTYPGPIHKFSSQILPSRKSQAPASRIINGSRLRNIISYAYKYLFKPIFFPDSRVDWLPWGLSFGYKLLRANRYDCIISFGFPFTTHLIAFFLKRLMGVVWIADYGDPWSFNPENMGLPRWRLALDRRLEATLVRCMDKIVVTTEETKKGFLLHYPFLAMDKLMAVSCGFDERQFEDVKPEVSDKFRIVYTGLFYKDIQDPYSFFKALKEFRYEREVEVIIAGNISYDYQDYVNNLGLQNVVSFLGHQYHDRVVALQKGASLLLLLGVHKGYQVSGKLFEYLAARQPVLAITLDQQDIAARLVLNYNKGLVVKNDSCEISKALKELYTLWEMNKLETQFDLNPVTDFSWENLANKFEEIVANVNRFKSN